MIGKTFRSWRSSLDLKPRRRILGIFAAMLVMAFPSTHAQVVILDRINASGTTILTGISGDGNTAAGIEPVFENHGVLSREGVRWDRFGQATRLEGLNGGSVVTVAGISGDGGTIVGSATDGAANGLRRAVRWSLATGTVMSLGVLNGGTFTTPEAVNRDGSVVVGWATDGATSRQEGRAFRWTSTTGMVSLGTLNGGFESHAYAVNANGNVVVGTAHDGANFQSRAFRWTQSGGMVSLGIVSGTQGSFGLGVSADGNVVVGFWQDSAVEQNRAFRWTPNEGMVSLGIASGWRASVANAVSADGKVIVGRADLVSGGSRGMRWTATTGLQTVDSWLQDNGVKVAGSSSATADVVNADGSVVGGAGFGGNYIARVSPVGSGLLTMVDLSRSLEGRVQAGDFLLSSAWLLLNGAHSAPLSRRVMPGQTTYWTAGDIGRDESSARSGDVGLAEVGIGRNFGFVQMNGALGRTRARQGSAQGTTINSDGLYVMGEVLFPLRAGHGKGLWAVLGGYNHWGDATVSRSYVNAGSPVSSDGRASTRTSGVRARIEWDDAMRFGSWSLSPYAQFNVSKARMGGYSETGGGFPVQYEVRSEKSAEFHAGLNAAMPILNGDTRLLGIMDITYRFERTSTPTTGSLVGLFDFNIPGQPISRDWIRLGTGIETGLGGGVASLMVNATSRGEAPNWWIAASWRAAF